MSCIGVATPSRSPSWSRSRCQGGAGKRTRQQWPKWVVAFDVRRRVVLGQLACAEPANASTTLRSVVVLARQTGVIGLVVADAEFDSERNHRHIRDQLCADSIIPAWRGKPSWQLYGIQAQMCANFPIARYRWRVLVESVFSAAKRKLSSRAPAACPPLSASKYCFQALPTTSTAFVVR